MHVYVSCMCMCRACACVVHRADPPSQRMFTMLDVDDSGSIEKDEIKVPSTRSTQQDLLYCATAA